MSKNNPTTVLGSPGRPVLPPQAETEILDRLYTDTRISSGEIAAILKKHGVRGDESALQDAYRKRLGQRLMASIRDERGKREVLAHGSEYVVVDCCNDHPTLLNTASSRSGCWTGCWPDSAGRGEYAGH